MHCGHYTPFIDWQGIVDAEFAIFLGLALLGMVMGLIGLGAALWDDLKPKKRRK